MYLFYALKQTKWDRMGSEVGEVEIKSAGSGTERVLGMYWFHFV